MTRRVDVDSLEQELLRIDRLAFADLKQLYQKLYRRVPPLRIGRRLLILAIAYELQRKAYGMRVDRLRKRVLACNTESKKPGRTKSEKTAAQRKSMRSGGRLVREWRGKQYEVYVADDGCYLEGKRFGSLSAAAEAITGVKRNGPAFFGLRSKRVTA